MSLYSRLDRLAADVAKLDRKVDSVSNAPQAQRTSIEAGTMDINDEDGNLISTIGLQEDGSGATRFFDGPTPPVPAGFTALADGPLIQGTWDGSFVDGQQATYDLAYLEVAATLIDDDSRVSFATITAKEGASASVVANQSGLWAVAVRSVSQAGKKSEFASAGTVEVKLVDLAGAIEAVQDSANGKNRITWSLRPPTADDPGIVGDTWWVNESRAREDGTEYLAIVAQYQFQADGWVQVEMAHEVIATVDLGKATVGELDGIRIMARTITGDLFSGDAFDGIVFRGNTFVTRDGNGEFSDRGLFFQKPDGTAIFRVPTDGTPISMSAADVQIQRAQIDELELNDGRVRSGGLFELSSGVTPPASPPELNSAWRKLATLPEPAERSNYDNLAYWATQDRWVRGVNVLGGGEGDRVEIYASGTGELADSFAITIDPRHGVTVIGDTVYIFGKDHDIPDPRVFIFGYDLNTGARTSRHEYTRAVQAKNALGNDGTNLIIGSVYNLELWVHRRNPETNAQVGSDMRSGSNSWPESGGKDLYGVNIIGTEVEVVTAWGGRVYTNNSNVLTRKTDSSNASGFAGWVLPDHNTAGCAWIDGVPYPMNAGGVVYEGSTFVSDSTVQACFTWYSGSYETTPSSTVTVGVDSRETVTISTPTRQGLQKRVYFRAGTSGTWNRANLGESETAFSIAGVIVGAYQPPTGNSFPNADPAVFRSTNGNIEFRGDGAGRIGPLTFNEDGTMTSTQVPDWVPITTFLNSWTAATKGFAPAYRVWPDGKVEWRGRLSRSTAVTAGSVMFALPDSAIPEQDVSVSVPINATHGGTTQPSSASFDFRSGSTNNAAVFPGTSSVTSVSLDSIFYYRS